MQTIALLNILRVTAREQAGREQLHERREVKAEKATMIDPAMKPERVKLTDATDRYNIPVKSTEQARQAMKVHVRLLDILSNVDSTTFVQGSGNEGEVNAMYRTVIVDMIKDRHDNVVPREYIRTTRIIERSDDKTVYSVTGKTRDNQSGNYTITVEVGNERNAMGKELFVLHSTKIVSDCRNCPTPLLCCCLLPCGLCLFAPCCKKAWDAVVDNKVRKRMKKLQDFIHSHQVVEEEEHEYEDDEPPEPIAAPEDITDGLVKRF